MSATEKPSCAFCGGAGTIRTLPTGYNGDPRPGFLFECEEGCTSPEKHTPFVSGAKCLGSQEVAALKEHQRVLSLCRDSMLAFSQSIISGRGFDVRKFYINRDTWTIEPTTVEAAEET